MIRAGNLVQVLLSPGGHFKKWERVRVVYASNPRRDRLKYLVLRKTIGKKFSASYKNIRLVKSPGG